MAISVLHSLTVMHHLLLFLWRTRQFTFFFCQVQGGYDDLRLRVNGSVTALNYCSVNNLIITTENVTLDSTVAFNTTLNI